MRHAIVAMSGGVDSSVAAYLVLKEGYRVTGATMRLFDSEDASGKGFLRGSMNAALDARRVAGMLGFEHEVFDMREEFKREVVDRFVSDYASGLTPNPCVGCNRRLKFGALYDRSREGSTDDAFIVTGHYAQIMRDERTGRWTLRKASDLSKDQSYFLSMLTQEQLSRTLFPLGGMSKPEVRALAGELGLITAHKKDSQDICFVPGGDYSSFIESYAGREFPHGDFTDAEGRRLGEHKGLIRYTIGQRKGLGVSAGRPLFVCSIDPEQNRIILGDNEDLFSRTLTAGSFNWLSIEQPDGPFRASARIRYRHTEAPAVITPLDDGKVRIEFDEPQRAITPGQTAVIYDGDLVLGGGLILR